jgi:hypothetical protein
MIVCVIFVRVTLLMWMTLSHMVVSYIIKLVAHVNGQNVNDVNEKMISLVMSYMDI